MQVGKIYLPGEIAEYCFFSNIVRLNGTLNFLYPPKWRKRVNSLHSGYFLCLERFSFSVSVLEPDLVLKLMVQALLPAGLFF